MYVARDENGIAYLYNNRPVKDNRLGFWVGCGGALMLEGNPLPKSIDPKWEDDEPIKVKLVRDNTHG